MTCATLQEADRCAAGAYRNGYFERDFVTRFGTIQLRIAWARCKSFLPPACIRSAPGSCSDFCAPAAGAKPTRKRCSGISTEKKKSRYTEEQIIEILKQHEAGVKTADLCREHGVSKARFYNWKSKHGSLDGSEAQRLR